MEEQVVTTRQGILTHADPQDDTEKLVLKLRAAGYSFAEIGAWLGVHWRTIYRWGRGENRPWQPVAVNQLLAHMLTKSQQKP